MKKISVFSTLWLSITVAIQRIERGTKYYYQQYRDAGLGKKKFHGVKINELDELEKLQSKCTCV